MAADVATRPIMENSQALKTALELSMSNLTNNSVSLSGGDQTDYSTVQFDDESSMLPRVPRSQNITHCVAVPSSEHVAEIVGRQGCKIKALRAKTNTYIKTPVRGEDPVFVITGRPEDVAAAKREVLAAAEHFTQIRAAKNGNNPTVSRQSPTSRSSPDCCQEKVTVYVKVPYRVVGLVVGPKGATIKRIQQITNTHIVTPSRDKEPCFEVSGKPDEVERAKREIESYIAMRTGGCHNDSDNDSDYGSLMSPPLDSVFTPPHGSISRKLSDSRLIQQFSPRSSASPPAPSTFFGVEALDGYSNVTWGEPSTRSPLSSAVFGGSRGFSRSSSFNSENSYPHDNLPPLSAPIYPITGVFDFTSIKDSLKQDPPSPTYSCGSNSSEGTTPISPKPSPKLPFRRHLCCICKDKDVIAALVPCGHNLFCSSCAQLAVGSGCCPVCNSQVNSMLRIYTH